MDDEIIYMRVCIQNSTRIRGLKASPVIHGSEYKERINIPIFSKDEINE